MKKSLSIGLSLFAAAAIVPVVSNTPVLANLQQAGTAIVKNILQPKVQLEMSAAKKVVVTNAEGKAEVKWQALKGQVTVQPGDVLRYTVASKNAGDKAAKNLVVTQPIPARTTYVLKSANPDGAKLTFSIDGGKNFVEKPMVKVKLEDGKEAMRPAPAAAYTHARWSYGDSIAPLASVKAAYEVAVK
jgi:uncharacterized repeat protein (TIGR01451 family)